MGGHFEFQWNGREIKSANSWWTAIVKQFLAMTFYKDSIHCIQAIKGFPQQQLELLTQFSALNDEKKFNEKYYEK